jgi:hypothetical protein
MISFQGEKRKMVKTKENDIKTGKTPWGILNVQSLERSSISS